MRVLAAVLAAAVLAGCVAPGTQVDDAALDDAGGGFSDTDVFAGEYDTTGPRSRPLEPPHVTEWTREYVELDSDLDGAAVAMLLFRPVVPAGERVPVVLSASPYHPHIETLAPMATPGWFVGYGYAEAWLAVRGTAGSGGCMDFMGPRESHDIDQAVTWLGAQDWSNGNVGMIGISYDGGTQWQAAGSGNPHLRTIVPMSGVTDLFSLYYRNGTMVNRGAWHSTDYMTTSAYEWNNPAFGRGLDDTVAAVDCEEVREGQRASAHAAATGERDPWGFWAERDLRPAVVANYTGSVLLVQGLQDWNVPPSQVYPWVHALEARGVPVKHLLGQWMHMSPDHGTSATNTPYVLGPRVLDWVDGNPAMRWDFAEILVRWFDYWLKEDRTVDLGPRVQVQDSSFRWRSEEAWPPADATPRRFWLAPGGTLADAPASGSGTAVAAADAAHALTPSNVRDPRATGPTAATFRTEPFASEFRFAGAPKVHVTATPTGPGGVLYAYLYREGPDGAGDRLGWGSIDLRFAAGGESASEVEAGKSVHVALELEPLDVVVPVGDRLVLVLTQGTFGDHATSVDNPAAPPFPVVIEVGGEKSLLEVWAFGRGEDAFFEPPR